MSTLKTSLLGCLFYLVPVLMLGIEVEYDGYLRTFRKDLTRAGDSHRVSAFLNNVKYIRQHNAASAGHSFTLRINQFSDLSGDELSMLLPESNNPPKPKGQPIARRLLSDFLTLPTPTSINWADAENNPVNVGVVSPVGDQGLCGSCWAFSAVYATEAAVRIAEERQWSEERQGRRKRRGDISLSVQELVACDRNGTTGVNIPPLSMNNGCAGGNPIRAFRYIAKYGLAGRSSRGDPEGQKEQHCEVSASDFEWRADLLEARGSGSSSSLLSTQGRHTLLASISGFAVLPAGDEAAIKHHVGKFGPVTVGFCGTDPRFVYYGGGILDASDCCTSLNHALLLVGYGSERGIDYWIAQNSWGTSWGEDGFVRIKRFGSQQQNFLSHLFPHQGICGLALSASLPLGGFVMPPLATTPSFPDSPSIFSTLLQWVSARAQVISLVLSGLLILLAILLFITALLLDHAQWKQRSARRQSSSSTESTEERHLLSACERDCDTNNEHGQSPSTAETSQCSSKYGSV